MGAFALVVLLAGVPNAAIASEAEEAQVAERISARAMDTLNGILGPGRAKVQVEVHGEHSDIRSESEFVSPIQTPADKPEKEAAAEPSKRFVDLPGYVKGQKPVDEAPEEGKAKDKDKARSESSQPAFFQRDHEQSYRDAGFKITSIQASVVLDASLDEALVRDVSQLLPQVLRIDTQRGDTLAILRAPMKPAWRMAFATPSEWRSATYVGAAGVVVLLAVFIAGVAFVRAGRALGQELGAARGRFEPLPGPTPEEPLPELLAGTPAELLEAGGEEKPAAGSPEATPLLGRRFDFLVGREAPLVARALSSEKPEDLSLLFGHLAESIPDLASRLFAHLPSDVQAEVSESLLKLNVADPERLSAIEERVRRAVENGVVGPQSLGRILSRVSDDARADLMGRLSARDARGAEEVERHLFSFDDLDGLEPAHLRRLLGSVPYEVWGLALRGASRALTDLVLADLPEGPRELVRTAAETPQPRDKVVEARSKILDALSRLEAKGEVKMGRAKAGGDLV